RNRKVCRCGTDADTTGSVVVRTVARTEPATEITGLAERNATEMGTRTDHDDPVFHALACRTRKVGGLCRRIDIVVAGNRILQIGHRDAARFLDLLLG